MEKRERDGIKKFGISKRTGPYRFYITPEEIHKEICSS